MADGRHAFLDEIGDISLDDCRPSCCGCSRNRSSSAWAGTQQIRWTSARIAATNQDLEAPVKPASSPDLYYRLNVF